MTWHKRLLYFIRRRPRRSEIEREMSFHLAERADDLVAEGMSRREAMLEARRRFGSPTVQRERTHRVDAVLWLESVLADVRYAARSLCRSPGFTLVAVLSLGLGIGANTAIFSLYNALILRTLPVRNPGELLQVTFGDGRAWFSNPLWEELNDQQDVLTGAFAFGGANFNLADGGEVRGVRGSWVSGSLFPVLGVRPVLGRLLADGDDYRACPPVAVVSYGFWQRELGGAAEAVGGSLMLNGSRFEILGVVDPAFSGLEVGTATDVYAPLCAYPIVFPGSETLDARSTWFLRVLARAPRGLTLEQVSARLAVLSPGIFGATVPDLWDAEHQERYRKYAFAVRAAPNGVSELRAEYRPALLLLLGVVTTVLLIACGNVANLLLARATRREHEISIRRAIGSGRGRLIRLLVTESLLLSLASVVVAVVFARWASTFLVRMFSTEGSVWLDLSLDIRVLGFAIVVATTTGVLFGLAPALRATRVAPQTALRTAGRDVADRRGKFAAGKLLVIGQLAMSLALVTAAALLIGTLTRLTSLDPGFNREGVLLVSIDKRNAGYSDQESAAVNRELIERLRTLPGVRSASASMITPISGSGWNDYVDVDAYTPADRRDALVWFNSISGGYFTTLQTPLLAGRDFDSRDDPGTVRVALINETMARRFFAEARPLGRHFRMTPPGGDAETYEVIGVVEDTKYESVDEEAHPIAYFSLSQTGPMWHGLRFQIRADGAPTALIPGVARLIEQVHPRISIRFSTLEEDVAASLTRPRVLAVLSGFFGSVALLLAMMGLYGTLSYRVTSRRSEIGLRLALGAARGRVLRMVLGEVGRLVVIGMALGLVVALAGARLLSAFLFGVTATDPRTLILSACVLAAVAVAAGALPAWRAARLDPMVVLKEE